MELHFEILPSRTKKVFEWLRREPFIESFYLAGGTALALYFGHRTSIDLDFFSINQFDPDTLQEDLARFGAFDTAKKERNTLTGELEKVKMRFSKFRISPLCRFSSLIRSALPISLISRL